MSILCYALSKKKFNRISACKFMMEMWEKLRITYEGTDKVKETRIDILVAQYRKKNIESPTSLVDSKESSSRKKHRSALKAAEDISGEESDGDKSIRSSEDEEAFLSRRLQRILAKKKYQSGRRYFKIGKEFKKYEAKDVKRSEPTCYECKKPGHIKVECPKLKKVEFKKKDNTKKFKRYKKKAMAVAWDNNSDSDSESSSSEEEEEKANLAFMANIKDKAMASRGRHGAQARADEQRHEDRGEQQAQHPRVPQYFLHHRLWTTACSCKTCFRQCRPRPRLRRHCRLSCRLRLELLRLQLQFPRSMAMVVHPSWREFLERRALVSVYTLSLDLDELSIGYSFCRTSESLFKASTYAEMVKKAQLLEDATNFTDRIKGKFVKKEMTSSPSSAKPTNGKKRPFNITEGPSQERKLKAIVPVTPSKSNCKHCDKPGHTEDE
ncbi:hypothetical protein Taro_048994 [Colocasia esculenta]|uniref:CCHC-type domain-containing protein n=1 Tax=Colocasia esculenta TaxID=4460 RepID=A0A843X9P6_COLES|nr:hypothetical protein [Colocasia esculenta]